jgi:hypothetical protein
MRRMRVERRAAEMDCDMGCVLSVTRSFAPRYSSRRGMHLL